MLSLQLNDGEYLTIGEDIVIQVSVFTARCYAAMAGAGRRAVPTAPTGRR